jgi:ribosomal protein L23
VSSKVIASRVFFPNYRVILLPHGYKPNALNKTLMFKVPRDMAKPQLYDYFTQVHQMKVAKINTLIQPSRIKRDRSTGHISETKSYKKCYVTLSEPEMIQLPVKPTRRAPQAAPTQEQ